MVSGADVTTEVSVVGKASDGAVPVTPGAGEAAGAAADETTELSSVGNRGSPPPAGAGEFSAPAMGDGSGFCGRAASPGRVAFSRAACCSFTCCFQTLTVSVGDFTLWRTA